MLVLCWGAWTVARWLAAHQSHILFRCRSFLLDPPNASFEASIRFMVISSPRAHSSRPKTLPWLQILSKPITLFPPLPSFRASHLPSHSRNKYKNQKLDVRASLVAAPRLDKLLPLGFGYRFCLHFQRYTTRLSNFGESQSPPVSSIMHSAWNPPSFPGMHDGHNELLRLRCCCCGWVLQHGLIIGGSKLVKKFHLWLLDFKELTRVWSCFERDSTPKKVRLKRNDVKLGQIFSGRKIVQRFPFMIICFLGSLKEFLAAFSESIFISISWNGEVEEEQNAAKSFIHDCWFFEEASSACSK